MKALVSASDPAGSVTVVARNINFTDTRILASFVVVCAVVAAATVCWCTQQGVGITLDSTRYVAAVEHPAALLGIPGLSNGRDVRYPPLLPTSLAVARIWNGEIEVWARYVNIALLVVNILLFGLVLLSARKRPGWIFLWCVAVFAVASNNLQLHAFIWSEPLYLSFCLAMIACLRKYLAEHQFRWLLFAAASASLGLLARYAGVSLVLGGAAVVVLLDRAPLTTRVWRATLFSLIASALPAFWILGNILLTGSATGRTIKAASPAATIPQFTTTMLEWWAPLHVPKPVRIAIVILIGLTILLSLFPLFKRWSGRHEDQHAPPFLSILAVLIATYVSFLVVSRTWFDHRTPFDWRILSPLFAMGLLFNAVLLQDLWHAPRWQILLRSAIAPLCMAVLAAHICNTVAVAKLVSAEGLGWNRVRFDDALLVDAVRSLPQHAKLYSNDAAALESRMGRPVLPVPNASRDDSRERARLRAFARDASTGDAWFLYFPKRGAAANRAFQGLGKSAALKPAVRGSKWTLYHLGPGSGRKKPSTRRQKPNMPVR